MAAILDVGQGRRHNCGRRPF